MKLNKKIGFTLALAFLGYLGAAIFYSYLIGLNLQTQYACPVCPHIVGPDSPLSKFVRRVLGLGTLNAALFVFVGWSLREMARLVKRRPNLS
jgi:hypothetical protein